jgi:ribonuclease P protein component
MLQRKHRITKESFKNIGNQGVVLHNPLFSVRVNASKSLIPGASFVVSHKISLQAVVRNTLRRRGVEVIRPLLPALKPYVFIFYLKKEAILAKRADFKAQIELILKKYLK